MNADVTRRQGDPAVVAELVHRRHASRAFLPEPVPHATIAQMLATAQRAPSWCNTQPWHVYVTEGGATDRFRSALTDRVRTQGRTLTPDVPMPTEYTGVHLQRRRESGWQLYEAVGVPRGDREASGRQAMRNFELFDAPHVAIVTVDRAVGEYGLVDTGIFVGHLLLVAESLGIGAIPQAAIATHAPLVRDHFGVPDEEAVLLGISFGWSDEDHPANAYRTSRADLGSVVRWYDA